MRYGICALLMVVAALLFAACSSPYDVARAQIGNVAVAAKTMNLALKETTHQVLDKTVEVEKAKRAAALQAKGCALEKPTDPANPALAPCVLIWTEAEKRYDAEADKVRQRAAKVDQALAALEPTIQLATLIVAQAEKGLKSKADMMKLINDLLPLLDKLKAAYNEWKLFAAQFTPLPGWLP